MRPIDADALFAEIRERHDMFADCEYIGDKARRDELSAFMADIVNAPTIGGWISVKDDLPSEHNSIFANHAHLSKHLWTMESDNVIVYVRFPDGTGRSTEGRLQDGKWWTRISPTLEPVVTHWKPFPEPPKEEHDG